MEGGQFLRGAAPNAAVGMTLPYDLAKKMLVENDATAAATAMMEGKIKIEGDMDVVQVQGHRPDRRERAPRGADPRADALKRLKSRSS